MKVLKNIFAALVFSACVLSIPVAARSAEELSPAKLFSTPDSLAVPSPGSTGVTKAEAEKTRQAREQAEEAKMEASAAKKEMEIQEKAVELEKKKAEVELKEAELAEKEAEVARRIEAGEDEIKKADAKAEKEKMEVSAAREKVRLAEEKARAAQERAQIAEEELSLALARAELAEKEEDVGKSVLYPKLIRTGIVLIVGYLLIFVLVRIINNRIQELRIQHVVRKNVIYFINLLIFLFIIFIWIQHLGSLTIFLSVVGAGVALALQEVILSIAGWFVILIRRPFEVGDRIELGGVKGDVIDIRLLQTSLLEIGNWVEADQSTGRIVHVPNSEIFKKENYNYSRGFEFIWNELKVLVTFESDWKRAEEIMLGYARTRAEGMEDIVKRKIKKMSRRYMIHYGKLTPIVYVNIKESGVELTLRYLTEARKRRITEDELSRMILEAFEKEENVNFAYPTYRIVK